MSHSWTGFGLILISVILQTTTLVAKIERVKVKRLLDSKSELLVNASEAVFAWFALISGLSVVVSPRHESAPVCNILEALGSSASIILWNTNFAIHALQSRLIHDGIDQTYPVKAVSSVLLSFLVFGASFSFTGSRIVDRVGLFCFFQANLTHVYLLFINGYMLLNVYKRHRHKRQTGSGQSMEKVEDDDFAPHTNRCADTMVSFLVGVASFSLLIALQTARSEMQGIVGFWEFWLLVRSILSMWIEWRLVDVG